MIRAFVLLLAAHTLAGPVSAETDLAKSEFFEQRIRPVLVDQCYRCHSSEADRVRGGLRLDSRAGLLKGGDTGPAIEPGAPDGSLLLRAIAYEDPDLQMPPKSRLSAEVVGHFQKWLEDDAPWPQSDEPTALDVSPDTFDLSARRESHWAWQPIVPRNPPRVQNEDWPAGPVDQFILANLEAAGLQPAGSADKRALLRRAAFVLTGLPPTPLELASFTEDGSEDGFARVVDRLLASPHFGERWARHWLDKVRYAETMGHEFDYPILGAWRYRDYVVRAFNDGVAFDQFTREQLAGDLLPEPRIHAEHGNESLIATSQYWLGQQVHSPVDVRNHQIEFVDNQLDVVTKSFLGMTVSCARCHDHKFDAISTQDYYALYGILASSRHAIRAVDDPSPRQAQAEALALERDRLRKLLAMRLGERFASNPVPVGQTSRTFHIRGDDHEIPMAGWFGDGEAFAGDATPAGQPVFIGSENEPAVDVIPPGWRHSASLSRKFQGSLQSPAFVLTNDFLHLWVAGQGTRVNVVIDGFTLIRAPIYGDLRKALNNPQPHWFTLNVSMWQGRRAWIEFADFSVADPASELGDAAAKPDGWVSVGAAICSPHAAPPKSEPADLPVNAVELLERWSSAPGSLSADETALVAAMIAGSTDLLTVSDLAAFRTIEAGIRKPVLLTTMADADGWDEPVFIRGNHRTTGDTVSRRFLEALADSDLEPIQQGSGRLELANAIVHPDNPLFARVTVNWVWAHLFGRGLVASVDNFGALGEPPSHPELLDWLAADFRRSGWSIKHLIRQLVLTRTWQMSSATTNPAAESQDPDNVLWHRAKLRRLEGETLRDAMLAISGRLNPTRGGPSVPIHLTSFMDGRGRPQTSGPLDGEGRRSLYLEVRRNFLSPLMLAFDTPVPASTVGRRTVSNVPAQALILMNDPFVAAQAKQWSGRLLQELPGPMPPRIERLYLEGFSRPPTAAELRAAEDFLRAQLARDGSTESAAWADLCHALFNLKEFLFVE